MSLSRVLYRNNLQKVDPNVAEVYMYMNMQSKIVYDTVRLHLKEYEQKW